MREIKFRVWDIDHESMIAENVGIDKIYLYDFKGDGITEQEGLVIMQYTGLKDKNGKELYEKDIVKHRRIGSQQLAIGEVRISPTQGVLVGNMPIGFDWEVIGNIYENPEQLKEEENNGKR